MSEQILTATKINVVIGGTKIVQDVSVQLNRGEVLAIVGPNGAGKTTLMKALLGLIPYSGRVSWAGGVRIGYVPQKVLLSRSFPLTVEELFLLKSPHGFWFRKKTSANQWLTRVGAGHLMGKSLAELSGGELQRVLIAYALAGNTNVLCLDEPSAGIDVGGGKTIYELLQELSDEHRRTIILISHDLDVVFKYADQVLCIDRRMICSGKPTAVLNAETMKVMYGEHASIYSHHKHD